MRLARFAAIALLGCVALDIGALLLHLHDGLAPDTEVSYEEGSILNAGLRITQGLTPYPDPHGLPCVINVYGPVFYTAVAVVIKLFGLQFAYARALAFASAFLCSLLVSSLIRFYTKSWALGLAFGFLYCCLHVVQHWIFALRVDFPGIALTLGGVLLFVAGRRFGLLSVVLFALAFYTKHSLLAAPAACFVFLMLQREFRKAAIFGGALTGLVLGTFAALQHWTGGWFAFHMLRTHSDPYIFPQYTGMLRHLIGFKLLGGVVAVLLAAKPVLLKKALVPGLYLAFATAGTLTAGKAASDTNHFLEWAAVGLLCVGIAYGELLCTRGWKYAAGVVILLLITTSVLVSVPDVSVPPKRVVMGRECEQLSAYLRGVPGNTALSENMGAVLISGKQNLVSNPFTYSVLVRDGTLSEAALQSMLEHRQIDVLVFGRKQNPPASDFWLPSLLNQVNANYILRYHSWCGYVYVPQPSKGTHL